MRLFDSVPRLDTEPKRYGESDFGFLNRVGIGYFERMRAELEAWLADLPEDARPDVAGRIRSGDDRHFAGGFWELYLHRLLTRCGYPVTLHPAIAQTSARPDFAVDCHGQAVLVEATVTTISETTAGAEQRVADIQDNLNQIQSPNFFIGVRLVEQGATAPATRRWRRDIEAWLGTLDPDQVAAEYASSHRLPEKQLSEDGWSFTISAIPKKVEARGQQGRPVGMTMSGVFLVDNHTPMLRSLEEKASDHRRPAAPLVIALLCNREAVDTYELEVALYGVEGPRFRHQRGSVELDVPVQRRGLWHDGKGPRNRHVSAITTALGLTPNTAARVEPIVWLNPWAERPLTHDHPFGITRADTSATGLVYAPGTRPVHEILGLAADWPEPLDWPKQLGHP